MCTHTYTYEHVTIYFVYIFVHTHRHKHEDIIIDCVYIFVHTQRERHISINTWIYVSIIKKIRQSASEWAEMLDGLERGLLGRFGKRNGRER